MVNTFINAASRYKVEKREATHFTQKREFSATMNKFPVTEFFLINVTPTGGDLKGEGRGRKSRERI